MSQPLDAENIEPTDAEIAAAQKAEEEATRRAAQQKKTAAPRRGPGRPPGARNKPKTTAEAADKAKQTKTSTTKPKTPPAASSADAERERRQAEKEARDRRTAEVAADILAQRPKLVAAIGMGTGIPTQYLLAPELDARQHPTGVINLTEYGQALAPTDGQVNMVASAWVRCEETEAGEQIAEFLDKWMPYLLAIGAAGAVGMYGLTVVKTSGAIKQMIAAEIAQATETPDVPGGATG